MSVAVMGLRLFAIAVWLLRRRESVYLLFTLYTLFMALRGFHYYMGLEPLPIPSAWFGWMTVNSVNALLVTWYFFVATLVPQAPRWIGRALLVLLATLRYRLLPRLQGSALQVRWEVIDVPLLEWLYPRSALHVLRILQEGIAKCCSTRRPLNCAFPPAKKLRVCSSCCKTTVRALRPGPRPTPGAASPT
ncbi:MAG: hypothetical protein WKG03_17385 [Telluria sp.]